MPRTARLDIAGVLQHVIIRGIERRDLFLDDIDRKSFMDRLSSLLKKTNTECLAWALLSNHAHLLFRPSEKSLASLMRSLLTGYAISFNIRHKRSGHLFQNRYKSIVCEQDEYLLELVRYIHLNPLRAGIVREEVGLDLYPWSGHAVLMGHHEFPLQSVDEVLAFFGKNAKVARSRYRQFVMDGVKLGKRSELVGGGLRRVLKLSGDEEVTAYDERILGGGDFVEHLRQEKEIAERLVPVVALSDLIRLVSSIAGVETETLSQRRRIKSVSEAKAVICYFSVRVLRCSGETVARALGESRSGVFRGTLRGEKLVQAYPALWESVWMLVNNSTTLYVLPEADPAQGSR